MKPLFIVILFLGSLFAGYLVIYPVYRKINTFSQIQKDGYIKTAYEITHCTYKEVYDGDGHYDRYYKINFQFPYKDKLVKLENFPVERTPHTEEQIIAWRKNKDYKGQKFDLYVSNKDGRIFSFKNPKELNYLYYFFVETNEGTYALLKLIGIIVFSLLLLFKE